MGGVGISGLFEKQSVGLGEIREGDAVANSAGALGYEGCWGRWREQEDTTGCYTSQCLGTGL